MRLEAERLLSTPPRLSPRVGYLRKLLQGLPIPLTRALLFGSRARGEALEDSDWDLLVVSPAFRGMDYLSRVQLLYHLLPLRNVDY